jgi:hypothetical protein
MHDIALPRHVVAKVEGHWARRLQQEAQAWTGARPAGQPNDRVVVRDGRPIPVAIKRSRQPASATSGLDRNPGEQGGR